MLVVNMAMAGQISELHDMFPAMGKDVIAAVLESCKNNVDRAVDELLTMAYVETAETSGASLVPNTPRSQPSPSTSLGNQPRHQQPSPLQHQPMLITAQPKTPQQKTLILLRGLPGSGKSTLARSIVGRNGVICCTDDFFVVKGRYIFEPEKLSLYHQKNQEKARTAIASGRSPVIVDNTNSAAWQMKPYVLMAREFQYNVEIIEPNTPWKFDVNKLERKNIHGISRDRLVRMVEQYERNVTVDTILQAERRSNNRQMQSSSSRNGGRSRFQSHTLPSLQPPHRHYPPQQQQQQIRTQQTPFQHPQITPENQQLHMRQFQVQQQLEQLHQQQVQQQIDRERQQQQLREQEEREQQEKQQQLFREQEERARQLQQLREQEEQKRQQRLMREQEEMEKERREREERERQDQLHGQVWGQQLPMEHQQLLHQWSSTPEPLLPPQLSSLFSPNLLPPSPSEDDTKHSQLNTEDSTNDLVFPSAIVDEHSPEILPYTSSSSGKSCLTATTVDTSLSNLLAGSNTSETQANSDPVSKLLGNWSGLSFSFLGGARDSDDNVGVSMLGGTLINQEETEGSKIAPIGTPQHQPKVPKQSPVDQAAAKDDFYTVPANTNNSGSTAELQVGMDSTSSVSDSRLEPCVGDQTSETTLIFEREEDSMFTNQMDNLVSPKQEVSQPPWDCWPSTNSDTMLTTELLMNPTSHEKLLDPASHERLLDPTTSSNEVRASSPLLPPTASEIELPSTPPDSNSPDLSLCNPEDDFKFLADCFPLTSSGVLRIIYDRSSGDITRAVEHALHLQTESDAESTISSCEDQQSLTDSSWEEFVELDQSLSSEEDFANDPNSSIQEGQSDGEIERSQRKRTFIQQVGYSDAEYAQMLQDQINFEDTKAAMSEKGSEDSVAYGGAPDDNLQLKLSVSLGTQLQQLYGSVEEYLLFGGEPQDDDYVVLLSERAAQEIHRKWIDTLKARKYEYLYQSGEIVADSDVPSASLSNNLPNGTIEVDDDKDDDILNRGFVPVPASRRRPRKKEVTEQAPVPLHQQNGDDMRLDMDATAEHSTVYERRQIDCLYQQFIRYGLNTATIDSCVKRNNFNFAETGQELKEMVTQRRFVKVRPRPVRLRSHHSSKAKPRTRPPREQVSNESIAATGIQESAADRQSADDKLYDGLRAEAALHAKLRAESFQKAAMARSKKQAEVAQYYAQQGHLHTEKMREANRRAAEATFRLKNQAQDTDTLDLHGLHVNEAIEELEKILSTSTGPCVYVITGRGRHSKGSAKIKPAIISHLRGRQIPYTITNEGMLEVTVNN